MKQEDVLKILQDAHTVPLGSEMYSSQEEYDKYVKIIESTIRWVKEKL